MVCAGWQVWSLCSCHRRHGYVGSKDRQGLQNSHPKDLRRCVYFLNSFKPYAKYITTVGIFDVMAVFNATNEYVLYYHSGRKTIRAFRRKDGTMIANFRVQADLKGMETTGDGRSVVLGMGDGSMTTLTIADPDKTDIAQYLKSLPSRNPENVMT